jgi:cellulose biosynthesis protein BcsE
MLSLEYPHYIAGITAANTSLRRGLVYAIVEDGVGRLDSLVHAALSAAGQERVCLVAPHRQLEVILGSGPAGALDAQLASGQLSILESDLQGGAEAAEEVARLATELAHFNQQAADLVLLDHADALFGDDDHDNLALLRQLRDWAERDNNILLLVLRRESADAADPLRWLRPCAALLGGIARLRVRQSQQTWQTFHWHHADGVSSDLIQALLVDADGRYHLAQAEASGNEAPEADDAMRILALRGVLQAGETAGPGWQLLEDTATLQAEAAAHVTATILLPFAAGSSFDALARTVLSLRSSGGRRVKIVVREMNHNMRQSQEALLMHLGANLVTPAGISLSRFVSLCMAVQGQVFNHALPPSFEAAVAAAMPDQHQGYLAPAAFIAAVQSSMQRGHETRIESCMVRLTLVSGLTPLDAMRYCEIRRAGDLITADADAVYLFLYACRDADLTAALKFLFRMPVSELFSAESRYPTPRDIAGACAGLARSARGAADLTEALAQATALAPAKTQVAVAAPANTGPAARRHVAVAPAVRRPLPLLPKLTVAWTAPEQRDTIPSTS